MRGACGLVGVFSFGFLKCESAWCCVSAILIARLMLFSGDYGYDVVFCVRY